MKKLLLIGVIALVAFIACLALVNSANADTCVNATSYTPIGDWLELAVNAHDGNWGTLSSNPFDTVGYLYMNYTIPADANSSSYWRVKGYSSTSNVDNATLEANCDISEGRLILRAISLYNSSEYYGNFDCWTGTEWYTLFQDASNNGVSEEHMCWYLNNGTGYCTKADGYIATGGWADPSFDKTYDGDWGTFASNPSYKVSDFFWLTPIDAYDGNWGTIAHNPWNTVGTLYMNYTIPAGANVSSYWEVSAYSLHTNVNFTSMNTSCDISDGFQLKAVTNYAVVPLPPESDPSVYAGTFYCWDGADWLALVSDDTNTGISEEQMCWFLDNGTDYCVKADNYVPADAWATPDYTGYATNYGYANYTVPMNASTSSSYWHMKDAGAETNLNISSCDFSGVLALRYGTNFLNYPDTSAFWQCWNGTDYMNLRNDTSDNQIYEEEVCWVDLPPTTTTTTIPPTTTTTVFPTGYIPLITGTGIPGIIISAAILIGLIAFLFGGELSLTPTDVAKGLVAALIMISLIAALSGMW